MDLIVALVSVLGACAAPRKVFPGTNPDLPFSSAVQVGNTLYVAGHLGVDPATGQVPADPAAEVRIMLDRFAATIERAGMTMDDLVQVQVHCADVSLYDTFNGIYRARFTGGDFPSRAFIGSGPLLFGMRFEMQAIAIR